MLGCSWDILNSVGSLNFISCKTEVLLLQCHPIMFSHAETNVCDLFHVTTKVIPSTNFSTHHTQVFPFFGILYLRF